MWWNVKLFVAKIFHPRTEVFIGRVGLEHERRTFIAYRPRSK